MKKLGMMTATALAALMLFAGAPAPAVAGSPKGVCQAGGGPQEIGRRSV